MISNHLHFDSIYRFDLSTVNELSLVKMLSVYMDHIFRPNLLEEDFDSEVYRRDQTGGESGVM